MLFLSHPASSRMIVSSESPFMWQTDAKGGNTLMQEPLNQAAATPRTRYQAGPTPWPAIKGAYDKQNCRGFASPLVCDAPRGR